MEEDIIWALHQLYLGKTLTITGNTDVLRGSAGREWLGEDTAYELPWVVLQSLSDYFEPYEPIEAEEIGSFLLSFKELREYFALCRLYSIQKRVSQEKNPYLIAAKQNTEEWLGAPGCYYFEYKLFPRPRKDFPAGIALTWDESYFYEFDALAERLAYVKQFYREELPKLREVMKTALQGMNLKKYNEEALAA